MIYPGFIIAKIAAEVLFISAGVLSAWSIASVFRAAMPSIVDLFLTPSTITVEIFHKELRK